MATPADTTAPVLTDEEKAAKLATYPPQIIEAIENFNQDTAVHNSNVELVQRAANEKKDPLILLSEIRETNPGDDDRLRKLNERITKLDESREKLINEANEIAKEYIPQSATEDEVTKAHEASKISSVDIRARHKIIESMGEMLGMDLLTFLTPIKSTRGIKLGGSVDTTGGTGIRPSYHSIEILEKSRGENGEDIQVPFKVGEEVTKKGVTEFKGTTSMLAKELSSRVKGVTITPGEITNAFLDYLKSIERTYEGLTNGETFTWDFSKEVTNSEGETVGTKVWTIRFVK